MGWADAAGSGRHGRRKKKLKPCGILELLGIALGCIRLGYNDFCRLTFEEFAAVYKAYAEQRDAAFRDEWQRMRLLATITIQPHLRRKVTPESLLPLPWDKAKARAKQKRAEMTPAQQRRRMEGLVKKLGDKLV